MKFFGSFERCLFLTVGLGMLLFAIADGDVALFFGALPVWAASWFITQGPNGKPLPRLMIGALVVAATAYTALTVLEDLEEFVPAVSRYLVWLVLIKLFDRVQPRDQAQLLVMSLFLVIGACLTSNSLGLGIALALYLPLFAWTAMLYQLHAGTVRVERSLAKLRPADRRRTRLSEGFGTIVSRDFVFTVALAGFASLFVAVVVFLITPRQSLAMAMGAWAAPAVGSETGFTEEVTLGAEGLLSESTTPVLDLRLSDNEGNDLGPDNARVHLRGAILDSYVSGAWRRTIGRGQNRSADLSGFPESPTLLAGERAPADAVIQEYSFRNKKQGAILALNRPVQISFDRPTRFRLDPTTRYLESAASGRMEIRVWSTSAPVRSRQARMPRLFDSGPIYELGQQLIADAGLPRDASMQHHPNDPAIAGLFQDYLSDSFAYSTQMTAPEIDEDPIEMFLFRTRVGHCEYFASAMAALCRSVGMDARVVTGYLASDYDEELGLYRVRESNAHAWTEVHVSQGEWQTFDPSPLLDVSVAQRPPGGVYGALLLGWEAVERLWLDHVVSFDEQSREAALGGAGVKFSDWLMGLGGETVRASMLGRRSRAVTAALRGLLAFAIALFVGLGLAYSWRGLARWRRRRRSRHAGSAAGRALQAQFSLFRELESRLRRAGFERPVWKPALEHARSLDATDEQLAQAASLLVNQHYASRFGHRAASAAQLAEGRALLQSIEARLAASRRRAADGERPPE